MVERKERIEKGRMEQRPHPAGKMVPKIETIHDISNEKIRKMLIDAMCDYLTKAGILDIGRDITRLAVKDSVSVELGINRGISKIQMAKWRLDNITDAVGLYHISRICSDVEWKPAAATSIELILMDARNGEYKDTIRDFSELSLASRAVENGLKGKVLDYGCNVGWLTDLLQKYFQSEATGIDVDSNAIELGQFLGVKGLMLIDREKHPLPFVDKFFDAVIMRNIFGTEQTGRWNDEEILREVSRVVKDNGVALIPSYDSNKSEGIFNAYGFGHAARTIGWAAWKKRTNI